VQLPARQLPTKGWFGRAVRERAVASPTNGVNQRFAPGFPAVHAGTQSLPGAVPRKAEIKPKTARRSPSGSLCRGSNPQVSMAHCSSAKAQQKLPYGVRLAHLDGIELAPFGEPELCSIIFDDFFLRLDHLLADRRVNDH
jgi:hypothetical protein